MTAKRITRREALAVGFGAVAIANASANAAPGPKADPNGSWVGKTVLPKKYAMTATSDGYVPPELAELLVPSKDEVPIILDGASYEVKGEKGTQVEIITNSGRCWVNKADFTLATEAIEFFSTMLKDNQKDTFALVSRGWAYHLLGRADKAIEDFGEFLKLTPAAAQVAAGTPHRWEGLVNRGLVYANQGEFQKALADLDVAVKGWPEVGIASVNRGYTYELMGEYAKAVSDYERFSTLLDLQLLALNNLSWLFATCPDKKLRDGPSAVRGAKFLCSCTQNREGMFLDTLAAACAEAGKFDEAVKAQEKALEDKSYAIRYGEDGQKRLQLYKDKKPFRTAPVKK